MIKANKRITQLMISTAISAAIPNQALAQPVQTGFALEEIVVTAQKREQSLQDVPIAVQALGADSLEQNAVVRISDIANLTTGLSISDRADRSEISMRGIGTSILGPGFDQSVPIYLDGVYLGSGSNMLGDLMDIQQIEVLKGPQGTLFGRNAAAGAVNVTTKAPHEDTEGKVLAGIGQENLRRLQGMVNTALTEDIYLRLNGSVRKRDGWLENLDTGSELMEQDRTLARLKLLWDVNDKLSLTFSADYSDVDELFLAYQVTNATPGIPTIDLEEQEVIGNTRLLDGSIEDPNLKRDTHGYAINLSWDISDSLVLTSITSYRTLSSNLYGVTGAITTDEVDLSFFGGPTIALDNLPVLVIEQEDDVDEYSQEFRLNGETDRFDWFVGASFHRSEYDRVSDYAVPALALLIGPPLEGTLGDDGQFVHVETDAYGIFGDVIWQASDKVNISFGLRYSYDEKKVSYLPAEQRLSLFAASVPNGFLGNVTSNSSDWDDLSGRLVADYSLDENTLIYAGITQGYKSGGYGTTVSPLGAATGNAFSPFDKETTTNYEAGIKTSLLGGRININSSIFYTDFEDYQVQLEDLREPATSLNISAPKATSHGIDFEAKLAATEKLTVGLNIGYLETEFAKELRDHIGEIVIPEGQDLLRAPRWSTSLNVDYVTPIGDAGELRFNTTFSYRTPQRLTNSTPETLISAIALATGGTPAVEVTDSDVRSGSYGILNARLSFLSASEAWEVAVWGTNLTDKAYRDEDDLGLSNPLLAAVAGGIGAPQAAMAVTSYIRNEPRMWGVDFTYNFH